MNVALGVLEEKKKVTAKGSMIQEVTGEGTDSIENHQHSSSDEAESNEENTLRIGNGITPLEERQQEQDYMAYMNLVSSLLGNKSNSAVNYDSDTSSDNEQQEVTYDDQNDENSESQESDDITSK
nr:unnamed protein product [Naegleria fowleri]